MSTNGEHSTTLFDDFQDKRYRHRFAAATTRRGLAEQIREMRLQRGWTQAQLARESGKVQETISQLEDPNYGSYTLKTLQRLAEALDVALIVRFAPFSELARWISNLSAQDLAVPDFAHDPGFASNLNYLDEHHTARATAVLGKDDTWVRGLSLSQTPIPKFPFPLLASTTRPMTPYATKTELRA